MRRKTHESCIVADTGHIRYHKVHVFYLFQEEQALKYTELTSVLNRQQVNVVWLAHFQEDSIESFPLKNSPTRTFISNYSMQDAGDYKTQQGSDIHVTAMGPEQSASI
jgi:hypothetical protein